MKSEQTGFIRANGIKDLYIDKNADEKVERFFKLIQS